MKLRREVVPPTPRPRRRWDPISFILIGLLVATSIGAVHEQRRLRARADAAEVAEAELERLQTAAKVNRILREAEELSRQITDINRRSMGDFPPHPRPR